MEEELQEGANLIGARSAAGPITTQPPSPRSWLAHTFSSELARLGPLLACLFSKKNQAGAQCKQQKRKNARTSWFDSELEGYI